MFYDRARPEMNQRMKKIRHSASLRGHVLSYVQKKPLPAAYGARIAPDAFGYELLGPKGTIAIGGLKDVRAAFRGMNAPDWDAERIDATSLAIVLSGLVEVVYVVEDPSFYGSILGDRAAAAFRPRFDPPLLHFCGVAADCKSKELSERLVSVTIDLESFECSRKRL